MTKKATKASTRSHTATPKLPRRWAHVKVPTDPAARETIYKALAEVEEFGILAEIGAFVRIERGALARAPRGFPAKVKKAAEFGLQLFDLLGGVVRMTRDLDWLGGVMMTPRQYEENLLVCLQTLLDLVHESQSVLDKAGLDSLAGFGGCDVRELRRYRASSGIEATAQIAWCIRSAVLGRASGLTFFRGSETPKKRRLLQTGREKPENPRETDRDDKAILMALADGCTASKLVANKASCYGKPLKGDYVRKRIRDLRTWKLIRPERGSFDLSEEGRTWVALMNGPALGSE